jgi:hypothetical protein
MATAPTEITEAEILNQVVAPNEATLPKESAESILTLHFNQQAIATMNELAEKNRKCLLSDTERASLEKYQRVGNLLNLLHAKARLSLANTAHRS